MKTLTKLLIVALITTHFFSSKAQNFAPIGAKWHYNATTPNGIFFILIESLKDTLVLGKNAKKISETPNMLYGINIIYADSNKVYFYDSYYNQFNLLYDFNANQGDTISFQFHSNTLSYLVDSVKMENIGGLIKKIQYITDLSGCWDFGDKFIESVGSNRYLFPLQCTFPPPLPDSLRCYSDSLINYQLVVDCELVTGVNVRPKREIYSIQNVVYNELKLPEIDGQLIIYDLQGRIILNEDIKGVVNLEKLKQGIYILILNNDKIKIKQKFIKL